MDRDIAERMRNENIEQFHTLVRMHLSFELDLNTDTAENEGVLCVKTKSKKRFNFPKKLKSVTGTKANNAPFDVAQVLSVQGIQHIRNIIAFLMLEQNITQEGIFRRTGSVARQQDLRRRINENKELKLDEGIYSVHDCASVLKGILADLPEPLLTDAFYVVHCQIAELCNSADTASNTAKELRLLHSIQLLLLLLPHENRSILQDIINMLHETTKYEHSNKMSAESLATLFSPHLICPRKLTPEALHAVSQNMSGLISFMITKGIELQDVPTKLATDIRAYFAEQRRRRILSPEVQMLDVSVTSDSVANTVFTFIDREKTAEAHVSNPTDTALAQLYAYIQTLPESSKKRKLVKQFNKENGQGTPLQTQMLLRLKKNETTRSGHGSNSAKSFSGSLKKHIFHNTLVSKTPKRCPTTPMHNINTPTNSRFTDDVSKPRTVFQSPIYESASKRPKTDTLQTPTTPMQTITNAVTCDRSAVPSIHVGTDDNAQQHDPALIDDNLKENEADAEHASTPLIGDCAQRNMKTFYKSEPNLSKILNDKTSTPILNRGKYIAKKLFNSVSMINLRRPFTQCQERNDSIGVKKIVGVSTATCDTPKTSVNLNTGHCGMVTNDADTMDLQPKFNVKNANVSLDAASDGSDLTHTEMIETIGRESESPITKSTHRMSKAMQESIMTPRSRKPVIIGAMLGISNENYRKNFLSLPENDAELLDRSKDHLSSNASLYKSRSEGDLLDLQSTHEDTVMESISNERIEQKNSDKATPDGALSTPFRKYLFSRSLLTTTPVDSSFSSQSDDFENLNDSEMSESLIYCLNGNAPHYLSPRSSGDANAADLTQMCGFWF